MTAADGEEWVDGPLTVTVIEGGKEYTVEGVIAVLLTLLTDAHRKGWYSKGFYEMLREELLSPGGGQ